jgi:hypothetical protein
MDRHTPQTKRVSQEVKDSLRYLRVIHRIDLRIQDHKGDVFMVGADGRAEESEDCCNEWRCLPSKEQILSYL